MSAPAPRVVVLGLSHRTASLGQREKAALDRDGVRRLLRALTADPGVAEAAVVCTCNRTEVYLACLRAEDGMAVAERELVAATRISPAELGRARYAFDDERAARHLFRVAAGLDSMVLGESDIQRQVRAAADVAAEEGTLGTLLRGLFRQALTAGARVRRETGIAGGRTSVSSVAVDVALRLCPDLATQRVLLVGAGKIAESTGRALRRRGARELAVANRSIASARAFAAALGARAVGLGALSDELRWADMVVSSTDAPHPIIGRDDVARALRARPDRPLALIDLAVPRDVDTAVAGLPGAILYNLDDLERAIRGGLDGRRRELVRAERILAAETERYRDWRNAVAVAPTVALLHSHAEQIRVAVLERLASGLDAAERERLDAATRSVITRFLHEPSVRLRGTGSLEHADSIRHLFALD